MGSYFSEFDVNPTTVAFNEIYSALEQGIVTENPVHDISALQLHEVQDYLMTSAHVAQSAWFVVNTEFWNEISETDQEVVADETAQAVSDLNEQIQAEEEQIIDELEDEG
ncbi:hypothetical protein D8S78_23115 [Natrialba swarupiae]|nr:hypothetical protein [Natrialba swarupiae]